MLNDPAHHPSNALRSSRRTSSPVPSDTPLRLGHYEEHHPSVVLSCLFQEVVDAPVHDGRSDLILQLTGTRRAKVEIYCSLLCLWYNPLPMV